MKILFVACLPHRSGLGFSLAETLKTDLLAAGHELFWHDLYAEGFLPLMDEGELARGLSFDPLVLAHSRELSEAGGLVILHPDWWGQSPAILKGWVDRVLREGLAWELAGEDGGEKVWRPLLGGKRGLVVVTTDSGDSRRPGLLRELWIDAVLGACGMKAECEVIADIRRSSAVERGVAIEAVRSCCGRIFS